jgi:tRNA modification GTPase
MFETIAAISTPRGEGGIGIVRMSGDDSINILSKIFKPISNKKVEELKNFTINYGHLYSGEKLVDEVMVSIMKGPKTYTKEDIVEINCHGGYLMTEKVLELILSNGSRIAEQGEFTRRAFMNGRLDLTQAEAVIDLIHGKTEKSLSLSLDQLRGDLKDQILHLKKLLLDVVAHINVVLDYPEEGIDDPLPKGLINNLKEVLETSDRLSASYNQGKMIKDGVKTAIVGKPNVGKSSLLNSLLKEERAIVTHIPGTTRDIIEEIINIKGIPLILADTAGIRDTNDLIESIGVEKSEKLLKDSDLILFVVDGSRELSEEDLRVHNSIQSEKVVGILNKIDIEQKLDLSKLDKIDKWIKISAKNNIGISKMEEEIYSYIVSGKVEDSSETLVITNIRHRSALVKTKAAIENIFETINIGLPMDLIAVDLKEALDALSEVTGEISSEDVLDHIFSNFCVGK